MNNTLTIPYKESSMDKTLDFLINKSKNIYANVKTKTNDLYSKTSNFVKDELLTLESNEDNFLRRAGYDSINSLENAILNHQPTKTVKKSKMGTIATAINPFSGMRLDTENVKSSLYEIAGKSSEEANKIINELKHTGEKYAVKELAEQMYGLEDLKVNISYNNEIIRAAGKAAALGLGTSALIRGGAALYADRISDQVANGTYEAGKLAKASEFLNNNMLGAAGLGIATAAGIIGAGYASGGVIGASEKIGVAARSLTAGGARAKAAAAQKKGDLKKAASLRDKASALTSLGLVGMMVGNEGLANEAHAQTTEAINVKPSIDYESVKALKPSSIDEKLQTPYHELIDAHSAKQGSSGLNFISRTTLPKAETDPFMEEGQKYITPERGIGQLNFINDSTGHVGGIKVGISDDLYREGTEFKINLDSNGDGVINSLDKISIKVNAEDFKNSDGVLNIDLSNYEGADKFDWKTGKFEVAVKQDNDILASVSGKSGKGIDAIFEKTVEHAPEKPFVPPVEKPFVPPVEKPFVPPVEKPFVPPVEPTIYCTDNNVQTNLIRGVKLLFEPEYNSTFTTSEGVQGIESENIVSQGLNFNFGKSTLDLGWELISMDTLNSNPSMHTINARPDAFEETLQSFNQGCEVTENQSRDFEYYLLNEKFPTATESKEFDFTKATDIDRVFHFLRNEGGPFTTNNNDIFKGEYRK